MERQLTAYLFRYMMKNYFQNKSDMARQLGLQVRQLQRIFTRLDYAKGGTVALNKLLYFCVEHGIALDPIIHSFMIETGIKAAGAGASLKMDGNMSLTSKGISSLMVPNTLNEQGMEMARSVLRILQVIKEYENEEGEMCISQRQDILASLREVVNTIYSYVLKIYTKEAANPLDY
ncbi:MAG: hypothetical protein VB099_10795 [Candidatus Limiplasma sp.]|nr:hypothetical protein [Candidatus Limiplasma sp.]